MSELSLLLFGCCVFFVFMAGCYVVAREKFISPGVSDLKLEATLRVPSPEQMQPVEALS